MNFAGQRYYTINRIFLKMVGLWPYSDSIFVQIYRVFMFTVLTTSSITQFAKLHDTVHDLDRLLYNLTYAVPSLIYILKFVSYIIYGNKVKQLLNRIQDDWNMFSSGKEHEIMQYSAIIGMRFTILFFVLAYLATLVYTVWLYTPTILDFACPLNETRPKKLPMLTDYFFINQQKYYFPLLLHQSSVIALGIIIVISTEGLNMVCVQHGCGLFEVTCYHLKHVFDNDASFTPNMSDCEKYRILHAKIAKIITIHKNAIEFLDDIRATFYISYLLLLILGIITITINMFRLLQAIAVMNDWEEIFASFCFVGGQYCYMFCINYFGQRLTDTSNRVFKMTYEAHWYTAPVQAQKILMFMMQKTIKGYVLNISSLVTASLETFASLTSMTLSYLTVIYSVR